MSATERSTARRGNRIAAVILFVAAVMSGVAATGTFPIVFAGIAFVLAGAAFAVALRGQRSARRS